MLLFVGQLLPHKRPDLLVEAMHVATTYLGLEATLLLVGQNRFARYADAISAQIRELNIRQVHVVGSVGDAQLAAMFRKATAFVTVSEHEGFCVPLLEAMAFDVPVIARACAAIPETVGDGGLLLPPWAGGADRGGDPPRDRRRNAARGSRGPRSRPARRAHRGRRERRHARDDRRGRLMRVLYVVQRYGEDIAGGAEQHARAFAERLVDRGHGVTVLTTCASSYVDWGNTFPKGWTNCNGVSVYRTPVARARNPHLFARFNARMSGSPGLRPLSLQRDWMEMQGPYAPEIAPWIRRHVRAFDVVVFITYLYWSTWAGLRECAGVVPTLLHSTAHDEPPLRLSIFEEVLRAPDEFVFLTPEEAELVHERFPGSPPGEVVGIGMETDRPGDADAFRRRFGLGADPYLLYVGRVDPAKGGRAHRLLRRVQAAKSEDPRRG